MFYRDNTCMDANPHNILSKELQPLCHIVTKVTFQNVNQYAETQFSSFLCDCSCWILIATNRKSCNGTADALNLTSLWTIQRL